MSDDGISNSEYSESSFAADSDNEIISSDVNNGQDSVRSTRSQNDKKRKGKLSGCSNRKQKKAKELTQNSDNDCIIKQVGCSNGGQPVMSQVEPMLPPMQFPTYGYAASSQGLSNVHNFGGIPVYPQNMQLPILPQIPQSDYGMPVGNNGTSCFGLLQEVMKKAVQSSGKDVLP